ncbi:hypothetical protein CHS0354_002119 [Potamilus streckersoni]|uniref:Uncharacterized protein n=1 Tax=Potamilus streckersoni TaxID=2493646 RepID=A0AAE0TJP8_9BIVA|nr:hypothetical protein CHS0354_002119 [Potamilus streckersoni]
MDVENEETDAQVEFNEETPFAANPLADLDISISDTVTENAQCSEVESDSITDVTGLSKSSNVSFIESDTETSQENSSQRTFNSNNQQDNDLSDWYNHRCYHRYWQHYHFAMSWCKKHFEAYKYLCNNCGQTYWENTNDHSTTSHIPRNNFFAQPQCSNQNIQACTIKDISQCNTTVERDNFAGSRNSRKRSRRRKKKTRKKKMLLEEKNGTPKDLLTDEMSVEENKETVEDGENFKMEITEEMFDFFLKSQKHKQERDAEKVESEQTQGQKLLNFENVKLEQKIPTVKAPKERPGTRRTAEMKLLYGKNAAMIHGMETALQMTFDRNLDVKQPKLWPNMPLHLSFS